MEFVLAQYTSREIDDHSLITELSDDLKAYFFHKNYGSDLKALAIGIICVSAGFDQFFKPRKPKYTKNKKTISIEGISVDIEKALEYDVKIDFISFKNGNEKERKLLLAKEITKSLNVLEDMKAKIKDFDTLVFKKDLEHFFKEKNIL